MNLEHITNATILVIDDNPTNLDIISEYLTKVGAKVLLKKDGKSGLDLVIRRRPDIILLDIMMPELDGYEICHRLKAYEETKDIPVIFMSALSDTVDKVKGFEAGGVDYITKPFQIEEVLIRVEAHLALSKMRKKLEEQNIRLQQEIAERQRTEEALRKTAAQLAIVNQELHRLATLDGLTQVANRRRFDDYLAQEWRRHSRSKLSLSLILCDIDYFKQYNDTYGHITGDDCLKQIAQEMYRTVKRVTDLVARYGGEEFAVILSNTNIDGAVCVAQDIQKAVYSLRIPHGYSMSGYVTLSLGVACLIPISQQSQDVLIAMADKALYEAKEKGRNRVCVYTHE
jgi:diguanylate cyclase (GGDEF)-like protein